MNGKFKILCFHCMYIHDRVRAFLFRLRWKMRREYADWKRRYDFDLYGVVQSKRKAATGSYFVMLLLQNGEIINCEMSRDKLLQFGVQDIWQDDLVLVTFHSDKTGWITMKNIVPVKDSIDNRTKQKCFHEIDRNCHYMRCQFF